MTKMQKRLTDLKARQSRERQRMAELAMTDELTEETRGELDTLEGGTPDLERSLRAAQAAVDVEETEQRTAGDDPDNPEKRERRELRAKVKMGNYALAAIEQRAASGAEAEYNMELGIGGNKFPLELLAPVEERATTGVDTAVTPRRWLDRLFADTAAMRLGITMESVAPGVASYPVTSAGAAAAQRGKDEAAADTSWTVAVTELKPVGNRATLKFSREDALRIPGLEDALVRDMRMALVEGVDRAIFVGDEGATGTDADITGLSGAAITEVTLSQTNKVMADETLKVFVDMLDGIHATTLGDLNVVAAVGGGRLWESTVLTVASETASVFKTLAQFLREAGLSWTIRGSIENGTANDDFGAFVGRGRGIEGAGVCPIWSEGELVRDQYTSAAKGTVHLSLGWYWNFGIPRAANFQRLKFVT